MPPPDGSIATAAPPPVPVGPDLTNEVGHRRTNVRDIVLDSPAFRVLEEGHIEPVITYRQAKPSPPSPASRPGPAIQSDGRRSVMTPGHWQVDRELSPPSVGHHAQDRRTRLLTEPYGDRRDQEIATIAAEAAVPAPKVVLAPDVRGTVAVASGYQTVVPSPKRETSGGSGVATAKPSTHERGAENDAPKTPDNVQAASSEPDVPEDYASYAGHPAGTVVALEANGTTLQAGLVADTAARNDPPRSIPIGRLERPGVPKQRMLRKEHEEGFVDHRPEPMTAPTTPSATQAPEGRSSAALTDTTGSTSPTTARRPHGGDTIFDTTDGHDDRKKLNLRAPSGLAIEAKAASPWGRLYVGP